MADSAAPSGAPSSIPSLPSLVGISIGQALREVLRHTGVAPVDARLLFSHALGLTRIQLITRSEENLTVEQAQAIAALVSRRRNGEPIAYLLGHREFHGLMLRVTPDVLIPRPDTELLVDLAIARLAEGASVLDMGTGSGAIAVAIAHARPDLHVTALDRSAAALQVARENAARHAPSVRCIESDWFAALGDARFDMIVSNPPYIAAGDRHLAEGDLRFEPADALTDHADGLRALRIIVAGAPLHLRPGGWLLLEHGYDQAEAVRNLLAGNGFMAVQSWRDLGGIARASGGHLGYVHLTT